MTVGDSLPKIRVLGKALIYQLSPFGEDVCGKLNISIYKWGGWHEQLLSKYGVQVGAVRCTMC